jgi:putative inorganic carbon (HCO3(-)) transporter
MTVLVVMAVGLPLFSWASFGDQVVMPRLAGTYLLTGALLVVAATGALWHRVDARAARFPVLCALLFLGVASAATAWGIDPRGSLLGEYQRYQGLLTIAVYVALMLGCMCAVATAGSVEPLAASISVGGALAAGYAVLQRLGLDWVGWTGIPEGRIGGAFAQPNVLGTYLVLTLAVSAGLLVTWRGLRRDAVAVGMGVMLAALVFTGSRGAWLSAGVTAAVIGVALLRWRDVRALVAPAVVALALAGLAVVGVPSTRATVGRVVDRARSATNPNEYSVSTRVGLWHTSLGMIADRPVIGAGPDAFSSLFASYRTRDQPGIGTDNLRPESSHNFFLDQLVNTGVLGLGVYVAAMLSGVVLVLRHARRAGRRAAALPLAMVGALAGYHAAVFFSFSEAMTGWLPWLILGGMVGACARSQGAAPDRRRLPARIPVVALGVAMIIAAAGLAWADYLDGRASRLADAGLQHEAAAQASLAARINPFVPQYLVDASADQEASADAEGRPALSRALHSYELLNRRFYRTAYGVLGEARVRAAINPEDPALSRLVAEARALDPHNRSVSEGASGIEGTLQPHARSPD